jgi:hypothetical protein
VSRRVTERDVQDLLSLKASPRIPPASARWSLVSTTSSVICRMDAHTVMLPREEMLLLLALALALVLALMLVLVTHGPRARHCRSRYEGTHARWQIDSRAMQMSGTSGSARDELARMRGRGQAF